MSTPPRRPHCPFTPQCNPNPSFQPVNCIIYHEIIPTISHACSPLPCTPFSTGANPYSAGFSLIPPHRTPCLGAPQPVLINVCVWGGTTVLGAGQVPHLANLAPGNKMTVAACPPPRKCPPLRSKWPLMSVLGFTPDQDLHHQAIPPPALRPRPCGAWSMHQGLDSVLRGCTLHFSIAHLLWVRS